MGLLDLIRSFTESRLYADHDTYTSWQWAYW